MVRQWEKSTPIYRTSWLMWFCYVSIFYVLLYKISNYRIILVLIYPYKYLVPRVFHVSPWNMATIVHAYSLKKLLTSMHCYFQYYWIRCDFTRWKVLDDKNSYGNGSYSLQGILGRLVVRLTLPERSPKFSSSNQTDLWWSSPTRTWEWSLARLLLHTFD
jgi:hypothetical protein